MSRSHDPAAIRSSLLSAFNDLFGATITEALTLSTWFDSTLQDIAGHGAYLNQTTDLVMKLRTGLTDAESDRLNTGDPDKVGLWFSIEMAKALPSNRDRPHRDLFGPGNS